MMNKNQRASLAKLSYKVAEILFAGVVIGGFMQNPLPVGKMVFACSIIPFPLLIGILFEVEDSPDDEPP